ncbi:MAG TPA: hypothetical protein VEH04_16920 [Verrucomicrobiae bacterium]|nr:hypothetical protein [Verrucomicrobiae bacterium]
MFSRTIRRLVKALDKSTELSLDARLRVLSRTARQIDGVIYHWENSRKLADCEDIG